MPHNSRINVNMESTHCRTGRTILEKRTGPVQENFDFKVWIRREVIKKGSSIFIRYKNPRGEMKNVRSSRRPVLRTANKEYDDRGEDQQHPGASISPQSSEGTIPGSEHETRSTGTDNSSVTRHTAGRSRGGRKFDSNKSPPRHITDGSTP